MARAAGRRTLIGPATCESLADHGCGRGRPDWNSYADDGGRADLLHSVRFARERVDDPDGVVLVGWSMGGVAAAGLTIQAQRFGMRFAHTVCLAGAFMVADPISGRVPVAQLHGERTTVPVHAACTAYPIASSRSRWPSDFASALRHNNWPVEVVELPADHGSIAGAAYDAAAGRYSAAERRGDPSRRRLASRLISLMPPRVGDWASQSRSFA